MQNLSAFSLFVPRLWSVYLLSVVISCCVLPAVAQSDYIDSLKTALNDESIPDSVRMELFITLGDQFYMNDTDQAKQYFQACYKLAEATDDFYFMGLAMRGLGSIYHYKQIPDSAMGFYVIADSLLHLDHSPFAIEGIASVKTLIADIERNKNNLEKAISLHLEAIKLVESSGNWSTLGVMYANIGSVFYDMGQFSKTLEYDLKALEAHEKSGSPSYSIANAALFVAGDYITLDNLPAARKYIENAERIAKTTNSDALLNRVYGYWGSYYRTAKEYDRAIRSLEKAVEYAKKIQDRYHEMDDYRIIGHIYLDTKRYAKSLYFLEKTLNLTKQLKNRPLETETTKKLAEVHSALGNKNKAVRFYETFVRLNDSLNRETTKIKINEIENKYQARQKQDSILVLQKDNQLQKLALHKRESQHILIIVGTLFLLLMGFLFHNNLRGKHRLLKQSEKLHQQQITQLEKERQLIAAQSLMKGQEEERSRLAKDLHDGVGGLLSGVKLGLSTMKGNVFLSEENARAVNTILGQLDNSIAELRRVSHNMMPEALIKFGLKEALENYCENIIQSSPLDVRLQTYGLEQRLEQDAEIILYRMVQELLNNVIKHADAKQVLVQLIRESDKFTLTVEDDGKGFDANDPNHQRGAGLQNIQARTGYVNGIVDIRTHPGEGTSVTIEGNLN